MSFLTYRRSGSRRRPHIDRLSASRQVRATPEQTSPVQSLLSSREFRKN